MPNAMADAQAQTQSAIHYYKPRTQSFINVTERAAAAGPRELAISATAWVVNPASFQWDYIAGAVRHGCECGGDARARDGGLLRR